MLYKYFYNRISAELFVKKLLELAAPNQNYMVDIIMDQGLYSKHT